MDGALNTHRIQQVVTEGDTLAFVTKGDANMLEDQQPVDARQVVGKVIFISAKLGRFVRLISNPLVFCLAIVLPLCAMLIGNLISALRSAVKLAKEEEEAAVRQALEDMKKRSETVDDGK